MPSTRLRSLATSGFVFICTLPFTAFFILFLTAMSTDSDQTGALYFAGALLVYYSLFSLFTWILVCLIKKEYTELPFSSFFQAIYLRHHRWFWTFLIVGVILLFVLWRSVISPLFMPVLFSTCITYLLYNRQDQWSRQSLLIWAILPYVVLGLYAIGIAVVVLV